MIRQIITIDEEKCNGCGVCAQACHEGAIGMVDGKAKLLREDYCDGLGNCLPACPTGAISMEAREAAAFSAAEVQAAPAQEAKPAEDGNPAENAKPAQPIADLPCGCPGTQARAIHREESAPSVQPASQENKSRLAQWPVQIKLVPVNAPYFNQANLLIAADCTAFAHGDFHYRFVRNRIVLVGCPKLDDGDYSEKLTAIIKNNNIKSVTVVRMEVPCCGGIEYAAKKALQNSGKFIPWQVVTIATDGTVLD
jgi:NAD-dependent dihydropyrimidine dehydrogenase PreA subunit